jgi:hypothetical protein
MSEETEIGFATRALEVVISGYLAAGMDRCVLAAACVWSGVKEMSAVTSPGSAAAALRSIADQIDPPAEVREPRRARIGARGFIASTTEHAGAGDRRKANTAEAAGQVSFNQEIASDVISEAIDLFDHGHPAQARALLTALRVRFFRSPGQSDTANPRKPRRA